MAGAMRNAVILLAIAIFTPALAANYQLPMPVFFAVGALCGSAATWAYVCAREAAK